MSNCIKCSADLPKGAVFCPFCGKKQSTEKKPKNKKVRGNGTGSVYKAPNGKTWIVEVTLGREVTEDGKIKRIIKRKKGFPTKREAQEYLPQLLPKKAIDSETGEALKKISLEDYWQTYKENGLQKLSKSKQGHYNTAHKKIPNIMVADIRTLTIKELQETVNEKAPTYYPAKDIKTLLSHLFDFAVAEQVVSVNLAEYIDLPTMEEEAPNPFNEEEIKALWMDYYAGNYTTGYALLLMYTGMMPGELFKLQIDQINLEKKVIRGVGLKTKKRKETPIVLADCIIPVIEELLHFADEKKFLPMREDTYRAEFKAMLKRCNCREELVPYSCRHTTATSLALENIAMPIIKEVMRHTKITTTQRYVHIDAAPMLEAVNVIKSEKRA